MTGILIFIIVNVGFESMINSALFLTTISRSDNIDEISKLEEPFYGSVNLDAPQVATNAATITISGQATEFDSIEYYINNVKVKISSLDNNTNFSEEIGNLKTGKNKIYAIVYTKDRIHSKKTAIYDVLYKRHAPTLHIEHPQNGETVQKQDLEIVGKTDRDITLLLNNLPIVVDLQGEFVTTIRLKEGENNLKFTAVDIAGNKTEIAIQIKYEKDD